MSVVDCEMAKILLKKFGYLEKRVTYLEDKSRGQENLIQKLKIKVKKLKTRNRDRKQVGQSSQVDCVEPAVGDSSHEEFEDTTVDVKPNLIELVTGSTHNAPLNILKKDKKLSQKLVVKLGVRCCEKIQEIVNSSDEKSVEGVRRSKIPQNQGKIKRTLQKAKTGGKSSKSKGPGKKAHICAFCSKSFGSFEDLSRHMRVHTGERPYKCEICSKSFKHLDHLKRHSYLHNKDERPFSCSLCSKSFIQFVSLQYHHMSLHKGKISHPQPASKAKRKTYICTFCSKSFRGFEELSRHMRVHTGEKPFSCSVCSKSFTQSSSLQYHMRIHKGKGTYSCSICSKKLGSKSNLKIHKRIHTGERPYECTNCNTKFIQLTSLVYHRKKNLNCQQE